MEEFIYKGSSANTSNISDAREEVVFAVHVMTYIIICTGLPLTLIAICAVYSLVRSDHVAPVYVINLLISDLIQLCCMIPLVAPPEDLQIPIFVDFIYDFSLMTNVCFMVVIALERYLVIAHPLWYRFRRTIKISVMVSIAVWIFPPAFILPFDFLVDLRVSFIVFGVCLFLPLPLLIFFLTGTLKALSASRVPSDEKRRIVATLVLVLLIYTLLFLPNIIWFLAEGVRGDFTFTIFSFMFLRLNPLADLTLYVFMRKGAIDKLLSSLCCNRTDSNETSSSRVNDDNIYTEDFM